MASTRCQYAPFPDRWAILSRSETTSGFVAIRLNSASSASSRSISAWSCACRDRLSFKALNRQRQPRRQLQQLVCPSWSATDEESAVKAVSAGRVASAETAVQLSREREGPAGPACPRSIYALHRSARIPAACCLGEVCRCSPDAPGEYSADLLAP